MTAKKFLKGRIALALDVAGVSRSRPAVHSRPWMTRRDNPPTAACPRCGSAFTCGMTAGQAVCWCAKLPAILPPEPRLGRCFCPDCLRLLARSDHLPD